MKDSEGSLPLTITTDELTHFRLELLVLLVTYCTTEESNSLYEPFA
jgi:hypothetical protein